MPKSFDRFVRRTEEPTRLRLGEVAGTEVEENLGRHATKNSTSRIFDGVPLREWFQHKLTFSLVVAVVACHPSDSDSRGGSLTTDAPRERWTQVASPDSATIFLDNETPLRTDSTVYRIWLRWTYQLPQHLWSIGANQQYSSMLQRVSIDCSGRQLKLHQSVYFDSLGKNVPSVNPRDSAQWQDAVPGTLGEELVVQTCGRLHSRRLPIRRSD
jgi:hypothetical protein